MRATVDTAASRFTGASPTTPRSTASGSRRVVAREFGSVIFGSASRTLGGLFATVTRHYERERIAFVYGEDFRTRSCPLARGGDPATRG